MDLSIGTHVPWVGIIVGTVLSIVALSIGIGTALRGTRDYDRSYSDLSAPYIVTAICVVVAMGASVGIDMWAWDVEGGGNIGTLRSEADRVYGIELSGEQAQELKDGKVLIVVVDEDEEVVVRLDGDELVTVGDWVPLER